MIKPYKVQLYSLKPTKWPKNTKENALTVLSAKLKLIVSHYQKLSSKIFSIESRALIVTIIMLSIITVESNKGFSHCESSQAQFALWVSHYHGYV